MRVLVIGANGNTGRRLTEILAHGPHHPVAMIRQPAQQEWFQQRGIETVQGDLEHPIDDAVQDCDAVIFAAGSGPKTGKDKTVLIDHIGAIRSMVAAAIHGARRYVMLSSIGASVTSTSPIQHYHRAKGHADAFLQGMHEVMEHTLDWTIVRPGRLTDEPGGGAAIFDPGSEKPTTSRQTLAEGLAACLDEPASIGKTFHLFDGQQSIRDLLRQLDD
ncbi:SDR family oxidoreductase [Spirochaeta africana]|uniref:NAD dependent epimerase/dehydratase family protein n=1 Tax=Spirochaeta africana (strain ATCC 700263 / DSM 8902 / Z-7692) TaxID=889378 RepID=H9UGR9_SPIAZ|nr:SDR family oxidoreductase [Spirochaeta africana]AFG36712.1 NAD dependent epimerase/dehydratase family protein [Spirochaeta africana DSM 8902]